MSEQCEIGRRLRWIEKRLAELSAPHERSIAPNSKVREARNIADKVLEAQKLIDLLEDPTERYVYQGFLDEAEQIRREIIAPAIIVFNECNM